MKIAIIGYSDSGKSTLAGELSRRLTLPVLYLDTVQFLPGWKVRPQDEGKQILARYPDKTTVIKNQRQLDAFLEQ